MISISLCMIVKNEEEVLERCLKSVKNLVDEIIIVDTGSIDKTKIIAKKYTNKIYDFKWCDDFSKARNFAFSLATSNYILWLDADDIMPKKTINYLIKNKQFLTADCYMLKYDIAFNNNKPTFSYYRERIVKNCTSAVWQGAVHECITPFGNIKKLNYSIHHKKIKQIQCNRNLKIYQSLKSQRKLLPREQYYYSRELYDNKKYKQAITELKKFINSNLGWKENIIDALFLLADCYMIVNDYEKHIQTLFKTFLYDTPRANICCKIGDYFMLQKNYHTAKYWYQAATKCEDVLNKGGFVQSIYYNYYPFLQLCVCFYNLGDIKKAISYNNLAEKYCPNCNIVKGNKNFFNNLNKGE